MEGLGRAIAGVLGTGAALGTLLGQLKEGASLTDALAKAETERDNVIARYDQDLKQQAIDQGTVNTLNDDAARINAQHSTTLHQEADAAKSLADSLASLAQRRAQDAETTGEEIAAAETNAAMQRVQAAQTMNDAIADSYRQMADSITDANRQMNDAIANADADLQETLARAAQAEADKETGIRQNLADKEADLAHQYQTRLEELGQEEARAKQQLADKILEIERTKNEQLASLDWDTHEALENAKTDHDREQILERLQHERQAIDQSAADKETDAQKAYQETEKQLADKKRALDEELAYSRMVAEREAAAAREEIDDRDGVGGRDRLRDGPPRQVLGVELVDGLGADGPLLVVEPRLVGVDRYGAHRRPDLAS